MIYVSLSWNSVETVNGQCNYNNAYSVITAIKEVPIQHYGGNTNYIWYS